MLTFMSFAPLRARWIYQENPVHYYTLTIKTVKYCTLFSIYKAACAQILFNYIFFQKIGFTSVLSCNHVCWLYLLYIKKTCFMYFIAISTGFCCWQLSLKVCGYWKWFGLVSLLYSRAVLIDSHNMLQHSSCSALFRVALTCDIYVT